MICNSCRKAGDLNTEANAEMGHEPARAAELMELAIIEHAKCLGASSCNCQHRVGVFFKTA